jgi:precorrin-2 C20-methyltransferase (EC 2.1.1.130)/cobalt-factor II C20-methyltransferase (EC 2.1.1.151)
MTKIYGIGVGPGDPGLITVKGLRILQSCGVVAYQSAAGRSSVARSIVAEYLRPGQVEVAYHLPRAPDGQTADYDKAIAPLLPYLDGGKDIAVICEGDPLLYGSFMYVFTRLQKEYPIEVIPGVCSPLGAAAALGLPLSYRQEVFKIIPATTSIDRLKQELCNADACAIIKLTRNFRKVRSVLADLNLLDRALYIERATMPEQKVIPIELVDPDRVPYFSLILLPTQSQL